MSSIEKSIDVGVPVHTAYNQWTQFEEFPHFMEGIEEVRQLDDKRLHWRAQIAGKEKEWDAEIVEQTADQRVSWRSLSGTPNDGTVSFQPLDANTTRVTLLLDYEPEGFLENVGDALGFVSGRVEGDLKRFKEFIEARGAETGAWRGEIHGEQVAGRVATERTASMTSGANVQARTSAQGETVLPVVEEEIDIQKRAVERGGVRVETHVTEQPVEEQVTLREERVNVERRPVDRPVSEADVASIREGSFEVTERAEEAVVRKQARVIEEVVIGKQVQEHTETIRDTARRTDVEVEEVGTERTGSSHGYDTFDADFRTHYQTNYAASSSTYDDYAPIYRYGYTLGTSERYRGAEWSSVEPEARRYWEERNPGTWEEFKDTIRYAWDKARGAR